MIARVLQWVCTGVTVAAVVACLIGLAVESWRSPRHRPHALPAVPTPAPAPPAVVDDEPDTVPIPLPEPDPAPTPHTNSRCSLLPHLPAEPADREIADLEAAWALPTYHRPTADPEEHR